jgi:hypothetical protein
MAFRYSGVNNSGRRIRRAVASHSKSAPKNPNSFSRYILNELAMHHIQRKEFILPCGFRVDESWAALRRSWQGFKIAHSKGDIARKKYYATFIHKVQKEMGISLTLFDPGLLDDQETTNSETPLDINNAEGKVSTILHTGSDWDEESLPNFEEIMNNVHENIAVPEPREEIFAPHEDRSENSCEYAYENKVNGDSMDDGAWSDQDGMFATYEDRSQSSCEYEYFKEKGNVKFEERKIYPESSCWLDPELENRKLKKEKKRQLHSCFYKSKRVPEDDKDSFLA